jgi:hypothetical protein
MDVEPVVRKNDHDREDNERNATDEHYLAKTAVPRSYEGLYNQYC